nr:hypothetical protein [Tanacetum cinerariifolium]
MLDVNNEELADAKEVLEVVKVAKLITKVVTTVGVDVNAASVQDTTITAPEATKKHKPKRKHTKDPEVSPTEPQAKHTVPLPSPSHDPLPSGEDSLKLQELIDLCTNLSNKVLDLKSEVLNIKSTYKAKIEKLKNRGRKIADIDADVKINLEKAQAKAHYLDLDHQEKVLSMMDVNDEKPADVKEVLEVVKDAKLITEVVTTTGVDVNAASIQDTPITTSEATKVSVPRKRREQVQKREKLTDVVMKYQALKRKPLTEVKARRNMIDYLKNMAGYKMNYFKGMTYDEIRPLFEKHYNYNQAFLNEEAQEWCRVVLVPASKKVHDFNQNKAVG